MRWIVTYITGMRKSLLTYHLDPPVLSPAKQWVAGYASGHGRPLSHTPRSSWLLLSCLCVFTKCWPPSLLWPASTISCSVSNPLRSELGVLMPSRFQKDLSRSLTYDVW